MKVMKMRSRNFNQAPLNNLNSATATHTKSSLVSNMITHSYPLIMYQKSGFLISSGDKERDQ